MHKGDRQRFAVVSLFRTLAWLLLLMPVAPLSAGQPPTLQVLQKKFPVNAPYCSNKGKQLGLVFRVGNCPCVAVADKQGIVRYIILTMDDRGRPTTERMAKRQHIAEKLATYIKAQFGCGKLIPFEDQKSGYVIDMADDLTKFTPPYVVKANTVDAIAYLTHRKCRFHSCNDGELILVTQCRVIPEDTCYIVIYLWQEKADVLGYWPGKKAEEADSYYDTILSVSTNLNTENLEINSFRVSHRDMAKMGLRPDRYLALSDEHGVKPRIALVLNEGRHYVGTGDALCYRLHGPLNNFIRDFPYPAERNSIPVVDYPQLEEPCKDSIITICRYFGCAEPQPQEGCVRLDVQGCRLLIPLPERGNAPETERCMAPVTSLYAYCPPSEGYSSAQLAADLAAALDLQARQPQYHTDGNVTLLTLDGEPAAPHTFRTDMAEKIQAANFDPAESFRWPVNAMNGQKLPAGLVQFLIANTGAGTTGQTPQGALQAYMEYLRRLKQ